MSSPDLCNMDTDANNKLDHKRKSINLSLRADITVMSVLKCVADNSGAKLHRSLSLHQQ